ncbi:hypothetical protein AAC387_Pa02g5044 [Persea americana]
MADETTVNGVDSILDPTMNGISKEHPDFEEHDKISALERKIADLEDEKSAIIQENKEQKEKIKLMTLEIDGFKKSKEEMAERLEKMQAEIDRSEDDRKALKAIAARASELETVFRRRHDLQSSMSECEDNREELQKLTGECEALKQSNLEKKSKIDDLEKEMDLADEEIGGRDRKTHPTSARRSEGFSFHQGEVEESKAGRGKPKIFFRRLAEAI